MSNQKQLNKEDRKEIAEILNRRANEVAKFQSDYTNDPNHFGSVELALSREISRLRRLAQGIHWLGGGDTE